MAFTEVTFSRLRESVKQSMSDDKRNGLLTGEIIECVVADDISLNLLYNTVDELNLSGGIMVYRFMRTAVSEGLTNPRLSGKNVVVDTFARTIVFNDGTTVEVKAKKGIRFGRALKDILGDKVQDDDIKKLVNRVNADLKPHYIMFTDRDIHTHYRCLATTQSLTSCMSKKPDFYGRARPDTTSDDPIWERYIYPTEAYNGSPNLRLALITDKKPGSKEYETGYPFIARAIVKIDDGEIEYVRAYGRETAERLFKENLTKRCSLDGGLLRKVYDNNGDLVAPYVDRENSLSNYDSDYLVIDDENGEYTVEHSTGFVEPKNTHYCEHCNDYHADTDDAIFVVGLGYVYGDCCEHYHNPIDRDDHYDRDDLTWSEIHEDYVHDNDRIRFIAGVSNRGRLVDEDYIHEDYLDSYGVLELNIDYECSSYAVDTLCIVTEENTVYLQKHQNEYYIYDDENDVYHDADLWTPPEDTDNDDD